MNPFQIVFLISLIGLLIVVLRSKTVIVERLLTLVVLFGGMIFVLFPDLSTSIANFFGIGRGADFVFYLFIFLTILWFISISMRIRNTDQKMTILVRKMALSSPEFGGEQNEGPDDKEA